MQPRKLAAIMFTDIEGYTALMQKSETQAINFRNKHRQVFNRETENHGGTIVQYYGDGTLSVFESAVQAVNCAIAIQEAMQKEPAIPVRIGIHLGDVVFDKEDIIGDGVNVASRVESLAVPGSVLISEKVYDEVKNHAAIRTQFLKTFKLKNVAEPLGIYAVTNPRLVVPKPSAIIGKTEEPSKPLKLRPNLIVPLAVVVVLLLALGYWLRGKWQVPEAIPKKVVAVIPFEVDTSVEEAYFQTGMTDGLIKELSKIQSLMVIDQFTTKFYAGISLPFITIGNDIPEVDYIISGNISRNENIINTDLKLIESTSNEEIWSKGYQGDMSEIRQLWAEIARDLILPMGLELPEAQALVWEGLKPVIPETYELYLKGLHHMSQGSPEDFQKGMIFLQEAVNQNPTDAYAYAALAEGYIYMGHGPAPPPDVFPKAKNAAMRAIQLDSTLADGWAALAHYETYFGWNWERAEQAFKRANRLNPNLAMNHYHRSWYLLLFGRIEEAEKAHLLAKELDPFNELIVANTGLLYDWIGRYEDGLALVEEALAVPGNDDMAWALAAKGQLMANLGNMEEALKAHKKAAELNPLFWRHFSYGITLIRAGKVEEGKALLAELEQMPPTPWGKLVASFLYCHLGDHDRAIESLQFEQKHGWYPWIRVWPDLEPLHDDPRFLELIREMDLPNPQSLKPKQIDSESNDQLAKK